MTSPRIRLAVLAVWLLSALTPATAAPDDPPTSPWLDGVVADLGRGRRVEAFEALRDGILARPVPSDPAAAAEWHTAVLMLDRLGAGLGRWSDLADDAMAAAADAAARPTVPPIARTAATRLAHLHAVALRNVGRVDAASALADRLGIVRDWLMVGPFDNERGSGFDVAFPPEAGVDPDAVMPGKERDVTWRTIPVGHALGRVFVDAMLRPNTQAVAYLATAVRGGGEPVVLRFGTTCSYKVFVDGTLVASRKVERPRNVDQDAVVLPVGDRWHEVVVKLASEERPWSIEARVTDLEGRALDASRVTSVTALVDGLAADAEIDAVEAPVDWTADPLVAWLESHADDDATAARWLARHHLLVHPDDRTARTASEHARRATELAPDDVRGWSLLAQALEDRGLDRNEIAINPRLAAIRQALEVDPEHVPSLLALTDVSMTVNPIPTRAEDATARALAVAPDSSQVLLARARALEWRGREAEAATLRLRAARTREGRSQSSGVNERVDELLRDGRTDEAFAELSEAFAGRRLSGSIADRYLETLIDAGRIEEAVAATEQIMAGTPYAVGRLQKTGRALEYAGFPARALDMYERVLDVCDEHSEVRLDLVRLHVKEGRIDEARARLEEIVDLDPGDDRARRYLELLSSDEQGPLARFEDDYRRDALPLVDLPMPPSEGNDPIEVLDRTVVWRVHPDGTEHRYHHLVLRALTPGGVEDLDVYPISVPAASSIHVHEARVIRPDGTTERAPMRRGRFGRRVLDVPPLRVGDVVDVEYRVDQRRADVFGEYFGTRHAFYPDVIDALAPTRRSEFVVLSPASVPLHSVVRNGDGLEASERVRDDGLRELRWVARDLARPAYETRMPGRDELAPTVDVTTFADWDAFARWYWSFIEKEFVTTDAMREKVAELTDGLTSEAEIIEAIAQFVGQEIRYNAWAFGTHGYEPYSAATIFERRFGDCKDKSILLRQLLAEVDIEAYPVLIQAESFRAEEPLDAAMVGHFNHCIAYLPPTDERPGLYLDATADRNPIEYLRADDQGARVLHVTPDGGSIEEIPYAPAEENTRRRHYRVELADDGSATVTLVDTSNGQAGVILRYRYGGEQGDIEKNLASELGSGFGRIDVLDVATSELDDIGEPARLEARFVAPSVWSRQGDARAVPLHFDPIGMDGIAVEAPPDRDHDLVLDRPYGVETIVEWVLPRGAEVLSVPDASTIDAPGLLRYRQFVALDEAGSPDESTVLRVVRSFHLDDRRIDGDEYAPFRDALRAIQRADDRTITIRPAVDGEGR